MNRRDIIIIAVLLNAAVLSFLFLTATRPEEEQSYRPTVERFISLDSVGVAPEQLHSEVHILDTIPRDEVDSVLKPYLSVQETASPKFVQEPGSPQLIQIEDHDIVVIRAPEIAPAIDQGQELEVVVKRGDVLEKIARANGTSVKDIKKLNHLTNDRISIGQVLRIPVSGSGSTANEGNEIAKPAVRPLVKEPAKAAKATVTREVVVSAAQSYTVQPGDNPWKIARQNKVQLEELLKLNGLTEESARNLKVGDKLRVR